MIRLTGKPISSASTRHWEETHCYLLNGSERSLLIDRYRAWHRNIWDKVKQLTGKPVTAVATHIHWDHIGGHEFFNSLERISKPPVTRVFEAQHSLDIAPEILGRMRDGFRQLKDKGELCHGSGKFNFGDRAVWV